MNKGIQRNVSVNFIGLVVLPAFVSLVTVPAYIKAFGIERSGAPGLVRVLTGYFGILDPGMSMAMHLAFLLATLWLSTVVASGPIMAAMLAGPSLGRRAS
jgi:hypothetical protein